MTEARNLIDELEAMGIKAEPAVRLVPSEKVTDAIRETVAKLKLEIVRELAATPTERMMAEALRRIVRDNRHVNDCKFMRGSENVDCSCHVRQAAVALGRVT